MSGESGRVVRIERTYEARAEDVFDAWTSPEVMRRWFHCAHDWGTPVAEVDLRVGGKVRVVMRRPNGSEVEAQGEYRLSTDRGRLVMTWVFDDDPSNEQLIELSFSEASAGGERARFARIAALRPRAGQPRRQGLSAAGVDERPPALCGVLG